VTGSGSALIVIPVVALISLAALLTMVFYADIQQRGRTLDDEPPDGNPGADPAICSPAFRGAAMEQRDPDLGPSQVEHDNAEHVRQQLEERLATFTAKTQVAESNNQAIAARAMQLLVLVVAIAGIMAAGWLVVVQIRLQLMQLDGQLVPGADVALTRAGLWGLGLAAGSAIPSGVLAAAAWRRGDHGSSWQDDREWKDDEVGQLSEHVAQQFAVLNQAELDGPAAEHELRLAVWIFGLGFSVALLAALVAGLI
jgi:hypothetical protein